MIDKIINYVKHTPENTNPAVLATLLGDLNKQSDWNQNDDTQPDYVKNRPFYSGDPVETVLLEETTAEFTEDEGLYSYKLRNPFSLEVGQTYTVSWDGTVYECVGTDFNGTGKDVLLGNLSIVNSGEDTGEPFLYGPGQFVTKDTSASHTISISRIVVPITKIDEKYLPDSIISEISTAQSTANAARSTANAAQSTANAAQSTANAAQSTANAARSTANAAQSTANAAQFTANAAQSTANSAMVSALWGGSEMYKPEQTSVDITVPGIPTDLNGYHLIPGESYKAGNDTSVWNGSSISWNILGTYAQIVRDNTGTRYEISGPGLTGLTISGKFMPAISRTKYVTNAKMLPPYVVFPKLTFMSTTDGSTKFITMAVDDNGDISTRVGFNLSNKFATEAYVDGRIQENAVIIKSSTPHSTKKFKITVDDNGTLTATEVTS